MKRKKGSLVVKTSSLAQYKLEFSMENQACLAIANSHKNLFPISCFVLQIMKILFDLRTSQKLGL